jgi:hypothetical protein
MHRLMVELPSEPDLRGIYLSPEPNAEAPLAILARILGWDEGGFRILDLPARGIAFTGPAGDIAPRLPRRLVFSLGFEDPNVMSAAIDRLAALGPERGVTYGLDVPIAAMEHWNPGRDRPPAFATTERARRLVGARALTDRPTPLEGEGVNVVMVDLGLNPATLSRLAPGLRFGGGWLVEQNGLVERRATPLDAPPRGHGSMVASALLTLAPRVTIFDMPLLPQQLGNSVTWASWAAAALGRLREDILGAEGVPGLAAHHPGPWVFCHAWGVYDRRPERAYLGPVPRYTADPTNPLNEKIRLLAQDGFDQIFAAGNGGQFCPHPLCGPGDTGPGHSIFGAACLPEVLTLGAVRADGMWIGYSSQGPGQPGFGGAPKPDLCAPSQYLDDADGALMPSGTSAACGMAAGAVAALRGAGSPFAGWSSAELFARLRETAVQPTGTPAGHDDRTGHGVLNLSAALEGF